MSETLYVDSGGIRFHPPLSLRSPPPDGGPGGGLAPRKRHLFVFHDPFLYVDQESNPRWLDRLTEDPFPPFKPAWSSREEFEAKAAQIVEAYPILKKPPSALPASTELHDHI